LTDALLWVAYLLSAAGAFYAVRKRRWPIVPATIAGALLTVIVWAILVLTAKPEARPNFLTVDLSLNGSFGVIFAAAGAALAMFLNQRRTR
jgi:ABC-type Fe3+-siderophore transport system permease subunit